MDHHPVVLYVESSRMHRVHVAVRLVLLVGLATVGCSSAYWLLYFMVPAVAALLVSSDGGAAYLGASSRRWLPILRWVAGAYAYLWLLTDAVPRAELGGPVELEIDVGGTPTVGSALARLLSSLPAVLLLALLSVVAVPLWVIGALAIVVTERVPAFVSDFLSMKLTYQFRLVAYHLSLVEAYPSLADLPVRDAHHPRAA